MYLEEGPTGKYIAVWDELKAELRLTMHGSEHGILAVARRVAFALLEQLFYCALSQP